MKRKYIGALSALLLLASASLFANAGMGVQGGYSISNDMGGANAAVTLKISGFPMVFAADVNVNRDFISTGITADYWIVNPQLAGILHWYTGPGIDASLVFTGNSFGGVYLAGRWVAGINVFLSYTLELYLQAAGELGLTIANDVDFPKWRVPLDLGFRFWF